MAFQNVTSPGYTSHHNYLGGFDKDTLIAYQGDLVAIVQDANLGSANLG